MNTLKQDLEEKAERAMAKLLGTWKQGGLSDSELRVGIKTIWDCVSGLVDEGISKRVYEAASLIEDAHSSVTRFYLKDGKLYRLYMDRTSPTVELGEFQTTTHQFLPMYQKAFAFDLAENPLKEAVESCQKLTDRLHANGYIAL